MTAKDWRRIEQELVAFFEGKDCTLWREDAEPFVHVAIIIETDNQYGNTNRRTTRGEDISLEVLARRLAEF